MPQLECPNCLKLQAKIQELEAKIEKLEAQLRRDRRQATPFSRDEGKADPQAPGRRAGQGEFTRRQPPGEEEIDQTHCVPVESCPDCGGLLQDQGWHEQFQIDLPAVEPVVTRFRTQSGYCPRCQRRVRARHPQQVSQATGAAGVSVGPRAKALAADLKHRLGLPYRKISELFQTAFGLAVRAGGLCQANARLAQQAEPLYRELVEAIRGCAAVHVDETGWRIGVLSAWLWVFTSQKITVYTIEHRRSHEVVVQILGRKFAGVLVSDCFTAYDAAALSGWLKQKCLAHLLHELSQLEREKTGAAVRFARALLSVLREALQLKADQPQLEEAQFRSRFQGLGSQLDALISPRRQFSDPDNARIAKRLRKQRAHLFTFLELDPVEATNNRAERALRPAVIVRKTGGCNRQPSEAKTHAILASLLVTARQQGGDPLEVLCRVLTGQDKLSLERSPPALQTS